MGASIDQVRRANRRGLTVGRYWTTDFNPLGV